MSSWKSTQALPANTANLGAFAFKNYLFAIGGSTALTAPSTFSGTWRARIDAAEGDLGPWLAASFPNTSGAFPDSKFGPAVEFVAPKHVWVAGGAPIGPSSAAPTATLINGGSEVMHSYVDGDGNLAPWSVVSALPINVVNAALLYCQGWLFLVGGLQLQVNLPYNTGSGTGFTAGEIVTGGTSGATLLITNSPAVGASGTLTGFVMTGGTFTNTEVLTGGTSGETAAVNSVGKGSVSGVANTTVYKARLGTDGSLFGPWIAVGTLPSGVIGVTGNNACVWRNEFIFLYDTNTLYQVRINRDGDMLNSAYPASFGSNGWQSFAGPATVGSATLQNHHMAVINQNELMLVGGNNGSGTSYAGCFNIHIDGSGVPTGNWAETMNLLTATDSAGLVTTGGGDQDDQSVGNLIYLIGGSTSTTVQSKVQVARYNASGQIGGY